VWLCLYCCVLLGGRGNVYLFDSAGPAGDRQILRVFRGFMSSVAQDTGLRPSERARWQTVFGGVEPVMVFRVDMQTV